MGWGKSHLVLPDALETSTLSLRRGSFLRAITSSCSHVRSPEPFSTCRDDHQWWGCKGTSRRWKKQVHAWKAGHRKFLGPIRQSRWVMRRALSVVHAIQKEPMARRRQFCVCHLRELRLGGKPLPDPLS